MLVRDYASLQLSLTFVRGEESMAPKKTPAAKAGKFDVAAIAVIVGGLVEVAQMVRAQIPKKDADPKVASLPELEERLIALEANWTEQAPLVQQLGEQLANVAAAGEKLNQKVTLLSYVLTGALSVSVIALLVALLR